MRNNLLIKIICSIPVILLAGYFSRILCVFLIIFRLIAIKRSRFALPSSLILSGLIILLPKGIHKINSDLPYLSDILSSDIYPNLLSYSKFLIIFGVILLFITYILQLTSSKINNTVSNYINRQEQQNREIARENDLKMREKREASKFTRVVKCPHCGANNTIKDKIGKCSHCRSPLE